jgi:hypothetical protein
LEAIVTGHVKNNIWSNTGGQNPVALLPGFFVVEIVDEFVVPNLDDLGPEPSKKISGEQKTLKYNDSQDGQSKIKYLWTVSPGTR